MALGFTVLRNEALKLLNETNTSVVGELASGIGGTSTVASDDTILDYINEATKEMCRTCVYEQATISITSTTARLNGIHSTVVWYPISVSVSGVPLIHCGEQELRSYDLNYVSTTGVPTHWYRGGEWHIGVYPTPSPAVTLSVTGASAPASITAVSGTISIVPDDILLKAIPAYVAGKLALKNFDDPSIIGRSFWKDWYDLSRMNLWMQLDASLRAPGGPFSNPPVMAQSK
jgi:hypothetical protein